MLESIGDALSNIDGDVLSYATMVIRFLLPALAVVIVTRCIRSLLREKSEAENWGYLSLPNGSRIELNHWENVIGRAKSSDIYMEYPTLSRSHAAVIRDDKGNWRVCDVESKTGIIVNGKKTEGKSDAPIKTGDVIDLGGVELVFFAADKASEFEQAERRTRPGKFFKQRTTLLFVTEFQLLLGLQHCIAVGEDLTLALPLSFAALMALMWISYWVTRAMRRVSFEIETLAFFLCTLGMSVAASSSRVDPVRQMAFIFAGVLFFFVLGWFLRDLNRVKMLRIPIAAAGLALLAANVLFAPTIQGARNWLEIAGIRFQPAEFVKIAFIFAGAATLERLFERRNLFTFVGFAGICVVALAYINDFGMALIFFAAYLVIAYLRSGDIATISLSIVGAGFAGVLALQFRSHLAGRFSTWGSAWDYALGRGWQQVNAMVAVASGGLLGVGAGNGWFESIIHSETDLVFALVSEELGLIVALASVFAVLAFAAFSAWSAGEARSSFYVIGACAASSMLVFQMLLNALGSVDILPFTGVTFPFVSVGGSSLISCWGLLAFVKAADTRQNASFVVKTPKKPKQGLGVRDQGSGIRGQGPESRDQG